MVESVNFFVVIWMKFFFLFTPFFALSMFLTLTSGYTEVQRRKLALQVTGAVGMLCFGLYFFGNTVFAIFGITLDAFKVGAGALLFLSAVQLVQTKQPSPTVDTDADIAVIPLAMPVIVGPATIGTLLVIGAEITDDKKMVVGGIALVAAIVCVGALLLLGSFVERALGRRGLNILSRITGLVLAALAAQMMMTGVKDFWVA
jgi:multiple antibiotic resistance protein